MTKTKALTGIPLQCRMFVETFGEEVRTFYQSADPAPVYQFEIDLFGSHRRFIEGKYDIYRRENSQFPVNNLAENEQWEYLLKCMAGDRQVLALRAVFAKEGRIRKPNLHSEEVEYIYIKGF